MNTEIERTPLEMTVFPSQLQKHVEPASPLPLKMMAARGMVPASPDVVLKLLYQLHFDTNDVIQKEATKTVQEMPDQVLLPSVQAEQPDVVLDWVARLGKGAILEAVALHPNTDDRTIAYLASHADAKLCEIIANKQVRMLRSPFIIEQIYQNPNARMATVDRLLELVQRNKLSLTNLPGLQLALESQEDIFAKPDESVDEVVFESMLQQEAAKAEIEEVKFSQLDAQGLTRSERERLQQELYNDAESEPEVESESAEVDGEAKQRTETLQIQISRMSIAQKIRLGTMGSREAIGLLVRDTNKLVHMAAIRSPRIRIGDVRAMAANKSLAEGVIKYIASNRDWTRNYEVIVSLVHNPKTPLSDVMGFMNHLRTKELRDLSRDRNVAHQVSRMAKSLLAKRSGGQSR